MKTFATLAVIVAVLLAACSSAPGRATVSSVTPGGGASASRTATVPGSSGHAARVFGRVFDNPGVTVTGGRLYVTWQVNPVTAAVPQFELTRVDQAAGAIKATRLLVPGQVGTPLAAAGWLWVPIATSAGESLLRLNPVDLTETAELSTSGGSDPGLGRGSHLAVADGTLWVADAGRLLRVSLTTGRLIATIPLPGAATSGVAADRAGTVLVVSEATNGGLGHVERRNPVSGTVIASYRMFGVVAPGIGGVVASGVWVAEPTGMLGYVERLSTATMTPDPATDVGGTNGIGAAVADGVVWVTDYVGGARRNYCANPVTGRRLATIPLPDLDQDRLLAISGRYLYYDAPAGGSGFYLKRVPVPAAC